MTSSIILEQAFRNKARFAELMSKETPTEIEEILSEYKTTDGKVFIHVAELTQNFETLLNAFGSPNIPELPKAPYLVWIVTNEKENVMNVLKTINKHSIDFGIFVFKASLNDNIITYKCLLKPDIKAKSTSGGKAKQIQLEYWEKYSEVCDELGEGNFQINPKPKHWQCISMGKAGVALWLTVNTQIGFIGVDFLINDDKELFEKLQNSQKEIEKDLGILDWENKPNVKTSRIRKTVPFDINNKENLNTSIKTHIEMAKIFKTTFSKYL
jgi:hypothetical protein